MRFYRRDKYRLPGLLLGVVDGGSLERRVLRLIEERVPLSRWRRVVSAVGCVVVMAAASVGVGMLGVRASVAQGAEVVAPKLEVVSVKKVEGRPSAVDQRLMPDGLSEHGWPLATVIHNAYVIEFPGKDLIVGIPSWASQERYDIVGKVGDADVAKLRNLNTLEQGAVTRSMIQQVLRERFQMRSHVEDREASFFALVAAKSGLKLKKAALGDPYSDGYKDPRSGNPMGAGVWTAPSNEKGVIKIVGQGVTLDMLAMVLMGAGTGRVVVDKTGSTQRYDFTLSYVPEPPAGAPTSGDGGLSDANGPSIFTAVQEQLGLKLEPAKGPVRTLVIDNIERPSAN